MAETQTLARPYAEAVFELAESQGRLDEWSQALNALSTIVSNPDVAMLLNNPEVADSRLAEVVIEIGSEDLDDSSENLVRLLVANGRLGLAPAIATLYEQRKAQAEHRVDVSVTSAVEFSAALGFGQVAGETTRSQRSADVRTG
jgi:F-type H+-transporting ATPase subunit delta